MANSNPKDQQQIPPSSPLSSFVYKATFICLLIALLPIFPPQSPDSSANNTFLTRTLELLRLLFVGIAIAYGLFSRRNSDPDVEKELHHSKSADTPQSYVSKILHVPSVFDDDETVESPRVNTSMQTWNYSQYNPEEPVVVVDDGGAKKPPLSLPVRSLKSVDGEDGIVLPSPIPWRSRSGRMEAEIGPSRVPSFRSQTPSVPSEIGAKTGEDSGRKKSFHKSVPPPAPPPPPLPLGRGRNSVAEKKDAMRSLKDELEILSMRRSEESSTVRTVRSSKQALPRKRREKKNEFREKMIIESDSSDSDSGGSGSSGSEKSDVEELPNPTLAEPEIDANEVDKKADEFIAKFREQIRLQRIASIKRSTGQRNLRSQSNP